MLAANDRIWCFMRLTYWLTFFLYTMTCRFAINLICLFTKRYHAIARTCAHTHHVFFIFTALLPLSRTKQMKHRQLEYGSNYGSNLLPAIMSASCTFSLIIRNSPAFLVGQQWKSAQKQFLHHSEIGIRLLLAFFVYLWHHYKFKKILQDFITPWPIRRSSLISVG